MRRSFYHPCVELLFASRVHHRGCFDRWAAGPAMAGPAERGSPSLHTGHKDAMLGGGHRK